VWDLNAYPRNIDLAQGSSVNIYFPASTNGVGDNVFYIPSDSTRAFVESGGSTATGSVSSITITAGTRDTGLLSFTLGAASTQTAPKVKISTAANATRISNPLVASNAETRYQTYVTITAANSKKYYGVAQFNIDASAWGSNTDLDSVNTAGVAGMPYALTLEVGRINFASTAASDRTYYVDVTFTAGFTSNLGSGATNGSDYKCYINSGSDTTGKCTISGLVITVSGVSLNASTNNDADDVFFTLGTPSAVPVATVTGYYILTSDVRKTKHVIYKSTGVTGGGVDTVTTAAVVSVNAGTAIALNSSSTLA
jgi:hypothetical protein